MGYAKDWGVRPSFLGLCSPDDDPDLMIAYSRARGIMDAYDAQLRNEDVEKMRRKNAKATRARGRR